MPTKTPIKAYYNGLQEVPNQPSFELWTILEPMGEHCVFSTLSRNTIEKHGCTPFQTEVK